MYDDNDSLAIDLVRFLGTSFYCGSYVVYFKNGNVKQALESGTKKYIWKVERIDNNRVTLENIATKELFVAGITECLNVRFYEARSMLNEKYISKTSLQVYKKLTNETLNTIAGQYTQDYMADFGKVNKDVIDNIKHQINKGKTVKNIKTDNIVKSNVSAAKVAAQITAGKSLNRVVREKITPKLPIMVRGYADTKLGEVVIANIVSFAVDNFASQNRQAKMASEAMMVAAMTDLMETFNIDEIISEVLSEVNLATLEEATK